MKFCNHPDHFSDDVRKMLAHPCSEQRQPQREPEWMRRRRETGLKPKDMTSTVLG